MPLTRDLVKSVKNSHKAYVERLKREAEDQEAQKRKPSPANQSTVEKKRKLCDEKERLEKGLDSSKAMLERAQGLAKAGVTKRNMDDVECGQVLLSEANSSLAENMAKLAAVNQELQKL